jgi:hypothetical protein
MDARIREIDNRSMGRTRRNVFATSRARHYVIVWDLQWQVMDCRRLEAGADLRAALTEILAELERDGWKAESNGEFGFVFVRRLEQRRLVTVTARDPYSTTAQSFSPFGEQRP